MISTLSNYFRRKLTGAHDFLHVGQHSVAFAKVEESVWFLLVPHPRSHLQLRLDLLARSSQQLLTLALGWWQRQVLGADLLRGGKCHFLNLKRLFLSEVILKEVFLGLNYLLVGEVLIIKAFLFRLDLWLVLTHRCIFLSYRGATYVWFKLGFNHIIIFLIINLL